MQKLIITRGLPASGKSTWTEEYMKSNPNTKRVNKDFLRAMLDCGVWSKDNERVMTDLHNSCIKALLVSGYDVIVDNTHLSNKYPSYYLTYLENCIFDTNKLEIYVQDFTNVPLEECIRRDRKRLVPVGEKAIRRLYKSGIENGIPLISDKSSIYRSWKEKEHDPNLPYCILVDLDGTLALFEDNPYDRDFTKDLLNNRITTLISSTPFEFKIFILSGRDDKFKDQTLLWLSNNIVEFNQIYMRKNGDKRGDEFVKRDIYNEYIKDKYNVWCIFDDRPKIVSMWRKLGLYVFDVNQSGENF